MKRLLFLFFLLSIAVCIGAQANDLEEASASPELITSVDKTSEESKTIEPEPTLYDRFVAGILKSRSVKVEKQKGERYRKPYWFECGKRVLEDEREERAGEWATAVLDAVDSAKEEFGVKINPWGVLATVHKEGGFDMCALDKDSRIFGWHVGAVKKYKMSYSKKEIRKIIVKIQKVSKRWRFDAGPLQVRRSAKKTLQNLDDILSLNPGVHKGVHEMANRAIQFPKARQRPWKLWPTTDPSSEKSRKYDKHIRGIARFLGARIDEI